MPNNPTNNTKSVKRSLNTRVRAVISDYNSELKMFSPNVRLYLIGLFLIWINFQVFMVLFNLYLKELGYVEGDIGWINSSRAIGMSVMALPAAMLISRVRLKPILLAGCFLLAIFSFGMCTFSKFFVIFGFSVASGMVLALFRVAAGPFFMRNSTPKERTLIFSASFAAHVLAGMVASAGAGETASWLTDILGDNILGFRYTLIGGILISILAVIPLSLIKASDPSPEERQINLNWKLLKIRGSFYSKLLVVNFLIGSGAGLIIPFLNLYFKDRFNMAPDAIGWAFFAVTAAMFTGSIVGPIFTKRFGLVRTILFSQLISMPFMLVLSYSYYLPFVLVAFVIRGGLMNMGIPIFNNLGMEISEERERGLVNAILMLSWTSSWMVSTAVGGWMIETYGYSFTINVTIVLYLLSTAVFYGIFRGYERRRTDRPGYELMVKESA